LKKNEEKLKFNGRVIKVFTKKQQLPNGRQINLEIVKHPGAVLIAPFLDRGRIVMLRQYRPVIGKYIFELPAGTLGANETHLHCAKRELIEETGYIVKKITRIGEIYPAAGYTTERIVIFKAENLKKCASAPEEDEIITTQILTRQEISKLFKSGKIIDAKTICALALCGWI